MSVKEQLDGLRGDISAAYAAAEKMGGEAPEEGGSSRLAKYVDGLAGTIAARLDAINGEVI